MWQNVGKGGKKRKGKERRVGVHISHDTAPMALAMSLSLTLNWRVHTINSAYPKIGTGRVMSAFPMKLMKVCFSVLVIIFEKYLML